MFSFSRKKSVRQYVIINYLSSRDYYCINMSVVERDTRRLLQAEGVY